MGPGDEPGEPVVGQARRVDERGGHALAQGRSRERGAVVRGGTHEADRGRPVAGGHPLGSGLAAEDRERAEERRQVLAGVEPARVHRVPPPRDAELRPFLVAVGQRLGPERGPRRERHHAQPVALDPQQAACLVARGLAGHEHDGRVPQDAGTQPLAEPGGRAALVRLRHRPRREVQQRGDDRDPRRDGQRPAGRVVDGARGAAVLGPPAGPDRRAAQEQRVHGQRPRAEQPGGRQEATADDLEAGPAGRGVLAVDAHQERERLVVGRVGVQGVQQRLEVDRRERGALRVLDRPHVDDDPDAGRPGLGRRLGARTPAAHSTDPDVSRTGPRPRSSSQRRPITTNSASTMIRRLILDWPRRRSRNVMGTSTTRAPKREAR